HRFGDAVHLCVSDDGPGIPSDVKAQLFQPFFTTRPQGTGLGLSVAKAVATAHGGDISVATSELGASFTLQLPAYCQAVGDS
ncbi:MAG: PAS domain-containing sensor histidine kinase, partial [Gammaproteobacteria bacterium]|nr:PAS domain-containing sensor histidine kinase [Gammaproteobacteria bacterium]